MNNQDQPYAELPTTEEGHEENRQKLKTIVNSEKGHDQWDKQLINVSIFLALVFLNIFRGGKRNPSIFGIKPCSPSDWISLFIFISFCALMTTYSIRSQQEE